MDIIEYRNNLLAVKNKLENGKLSLGFIGGSITEDGRAANNWPEPVIRWFVEGFPHARVTVENAALGATGSDLAVFRAKHELIDRECDLVFVEFAVNDYTTPSEQRMRAREGLIRQILENSRSEIVLVYTYSQRMYMAMSQGEVPDSILEFEQLAEHYGINSIWAGRYAWNEVEKGRMSWDEWLPDGLHPTHRGSLSYGQSVITFLENRLNAEIELERVKANKSLPAPLNPLHWERMELVSFEDVKLDGPWSIRRAVVLLPRVEQILSTSAIGAKLSFSFTGRGLALAFDFGKKSAEFTYRLDGGAAITTSRDRPDWCGDGGWFRIQWIADELPEGEHHFELEVVHGNREDCKGTNFHLGLIGVLK